MSIPQGALEHLVSLTALRDREQLDQGLAVAFSRILSVRSVGVYRVIQDREGGKHWFKCAYFRPDHPLECDPGWVDPNSLPAFDDMPLRQKVLEDPTVLQVPTLERNVEKGTIVFEDEDGRATRIAEDVFERLEARIRGRF